MDVEKIPLEEWQKKGGQPKADFNECLRLSRSLLEHNVHKPEELNSREVLAISYYYDRASDHGLIGKQINQILVYVITSLFTPYQNCVIDSTEGGELTIKELFKSAEQSKSFKYSVSFQ